jgi:hypothetical protein
MATEGMGGILDFGFWILVWWQSFKISESAAVVVEWHSIRKALGRREARCDLAPAMKRYTVIWDNVVESNFLDAWVKSDSCSRAALTELAGTIDRALAMNADAQGEEHAAEGTRAVDVRVAAAKVTVFNKVFVDDRVARVTRLVFRRAVAS